MGDTAGAAACGRNRALDRCRSARDEQGRKVPSPADAGGARMTPPSLDEDDIRVETAEALGEHATERTVRRSTIRALVAWVAIVVLGHLLVRWVMIDTGVQRHDAAPLHAMFDPELHRSAVWAIVLAAAAIWSAHRV